MGRRKTAKNAGPHLTTQRTPLQSPHPNSFRGPQKTHGVVHPSQQGIPQPFLDVPPPLGALQQARLCRRMERWKDGGTQRPGKAGPVVPCSPRAARGSRQRKGEDRSAAAPGGARRAQQQHRPVQPCSAADPGAAPPQPPSHGHAVPAHPGRYCPPRSPRPSSSGSRRHAGLQPGPGRRAAGSTVERPAGQNAERGRGGPKRLRSPLEPGAAPRPARCHKGRHAALRPHLPARWAAVRARRRHGAVRPCPPPGGTGRRQREQRGRAWRRGRAVTGRAGSCDTAGAGRKAAPPQSRGSVAARPRQRLALG